MLDTDWLSGCDHVLSIVTRGIRLFSAFSALYNSNCLCTPKAKEKGDVCAQARYQGVVWIT